MTPGLTRREREVTDIQEILKILDKSKIIHIGLVDGDEPYVVPMNYGYTYENERLTFYLHCATEGKKLDVIRKNPKVFFSIESDIEPFSGQVACQYGTAYSSVMGKGIAYIHEEAEDKMNFLSLFMKTQTGLDFEFNERLVSAVTLIKIDVTEFTAKHRPKPINA
ncbi:MAG: pyridoxamine 5'-phosphate oxidase family protein [Clostridia bacterium]|nr:pyridoxamine 5'-phosphate oxidase family protein [Clostridia bacterium]